MLYFQNERCYGTGKNRDYFMESAWVRDFHTKKNKIKINIASANHPYLQSRTELRRARLTTSG